MTIVFSILGLIEYFTCKRYYGRWPHRRRKIEGPWVRVLGLVTLIIDWIPFVFLLLMPLADSTPVREAGIDISFLGIASLFCSFVLNWIIQTLAMLLFSQPAED